MKNKAEKYFQKSLYRRPYRRKATAYENIGLFRPIGLSKTSPSIASDADHTIVYAQIRDGDDQGSQGRSSWLSGLIVVADGGNFFNIDLDNARANNIAMGARPGELTMLVADGMEHPLLKARGPYDLIIANILAGPLINLAPHFAKALIPGGHLVLAGLLETQEPQVRRAARAAGMRIAERKVNGDWSILWLRKRVSAISR